MSPEWIEMYVSMNDYADGYIEATVGREEAGYYDPREDNFANGAEKLGNIIVDAAHLLPDCMASLELLAALEGIHDHLCNLADWQYDNNEECESVL